MAAIAYEGANLTWQRVQEFLEGVSATQASKKALLWSVKQWLATQKGNPKLAFLTWTDAQAIAVTGVQLGTGTPKVIAAFAIKTGTTGLTGAGTATKSYIVIGDDATDGTTAASNRIVMPLLAAGEEALFITPQPSKAGVAFANGVVVSAVTAAIGKAGATSSTAGDAGPGFVIVSA